MLTVLLFVAAGLGLVLVVVGLVILFRQPIGESVSVTFAGATVTGAAGITLVLVGSILVILPIVYAITRSPGGPNSQPPPSTATTPPSSSSSSTATSPVTMTTATAATTTTVDVPTPRILTPPSGPVEPQVVATGTVHKLPPGHEVWLVVQIGDYYPQDGPVRVRPDGGWSSGAQFGGPGVFALHLVDAGPSGVAKFADYFRRGRAVGDFPGIPPSDLPSDVTILASVTNLVRR
jgi:hypothetical protein